MDTCRGCLASEPDMVNIFQTHLYEDFSHFSNVQVLQRDGLPQCLCKTCHSVLITCQDFRRRCQLSYQLLLSKRKEEDMKVKDHTDNYHHITTGKETQKTEVKQLAENTIVSIFSETCLILHITPNYFDSDNDAILPCPFSCKNNFTKRNHLMSHLVRSHGITESKFLLEIKFHCVYEDCPYKMNSGANKYFPLRKTLKNHIRNVHESKNIVCDVCKLAFPQQSAFDRHKETCESKFVCAGCHVEYKTNERLMVHLMRKHPDLHREYKRQKKELKLAKKRAGDDKMATKRSKSENCLHTKDEKKTLSTQTLCPKYDSERINGLFKCSNVQSLKHTQTDELNLFTTNETQTVFEDLLSIRSEEEFETVSLSDIQTQTYDKEMATCETQTNPFLPTMESPDHKETQTCFCYLDSPNPSSHLTFPKYLFDSVNSSSNGQLTSTETQTAECQSRDILLSSIETQTCEDYTLDTEQLTI